VPLKLISLPLPKNTNLMKKINVSLHNKDIRG